MRRRAAIVFLFLLVFAPSASAWTWPVQGPVLNPFAFDRAHPYAGGQHRGVDIGAATGADVAAPASGTVTFAGSVPTSGKTVSILTGDALSVTLTHLASVAVAKGAAVAEGAVVGTVGPSGTPELTVPYVHLGIRTAADDDGYLDPLGLLPPLTPPAPPAAAEPPAVAPPVAPAEPAPAPPAEPLPAPPVQPPAPAPPTDAAPTFDPAAPTATPAPPAAEPAVPVTPAAPQEPSPLLEPTMTQAPELPAAEPIAAEEVLPSIDLDAVRPLPHRRPQLAAPRRGGVGQTRTPRSAVEHAMRHVPASARGMRSLPVAASGRPAARHRGSARSLWLLAIPAVVLAGVLGLVRMIPSPSSRPEGASTAREDPRRTGVAVWQRPASHRPRGGLRRAGGRVRPLSPAEGRRRPDGERDGRARHAGDGGGRPERRVAA